jgi:SAM-dependent methyltransferase
MINPRMTDSSYAEFYDHEYRPLYTGKSTNAENFFRAQTTRGQRLYQYLLERDLLPTVPQPLVLEVGCGAGGILAHFKSRGFKVKGIDLGREYLQYGKENHQLDLTVGTIKDLQPDQPPDLIIYSHVMEHIPDPNAELERLYEIAGNQTLVYVEVPGIKYLSLGYRKDPLRYFQNAHTFSFSLTTLNNLFTRHGFIKLHGDEFVKAVFKKGHKVAAPPVNDFEQVLAYLSAIEKERKYYAISRARFQVLSNAISNHIASILKK